MPLFETMNESDAYDVILCGGGIAGQSLARQLKISLPDITVLLIERAVFPLPVAAHKVGESTGDIGGHYFRDVLQLQDYFQNHHYAKLGFRYFFGNSQADFSQRPELGISNFPAHTALQIDRGVFENDLCTFNRRAGVQVVEGAMVSDIAISNTQGLHSVTYKLVKSSGEANSTPITVKGKWVIDAMGRRRFLQRKLGLGTEAKEVYSAVWFRVEGKVDVEQFVPETDDAWHNRVPYNIRYYSTNHIMGKGYWVWIIPLASHHTSIGIVTSEDVHPFSSYNLPDRARQWLQQYEPVVYSHVGHLAMVDFKKLKNYSFSSRQIFSCERWACVGEAAVFPDPFYSPGSNLIGFENSIVTKMIESDAYQGLKESDVHFYNAFVISQNDWLTHAIQSAYHHFHHEVVMSLNFIWDLAVDKATAFAQMLNRTFLDPALSSKIQEKTKNLFPLMIRVQQLFKQWETKSLNRLTFQYIDYYKIPFLISFHHEKDQPGRDSENYIHEQARRMEKMEELAQVIFFLALEDTLPEKLDMFSPPVWVNTWAIGLEPEKWEKEGLFAPVTAPRDLTLTLQQFASQFELTVPGKVLNGLFSAKEPAPEIELTTNFNFPAYE